MVFGASSSYVVCLFVFYLCFSFPPSSSGRQYNRRRLDFKPNSSDSVFSFLLLVDLPASLPVIYPRLLIRHISTQFWIPLFEFNACFIADFIDFHVWSLLIRCRNWKGISGGSLSLSLICLKIGNFSIAIASSDTVWFAIAEIMFSNTIVSMYSVINFQLNEWIVFSCYFLGL